MLTSNIRAIVLLIILLPSLPIAIPARNSLHKLLIPKNLTPLPHPHPHLRPRTLPKRPPTTKATHDLVNLPLCQIRLPRLRRNMQQRIFQLRQVYLAAVLVVESCECV
jgi:hypothetical protein